jgi:hypothetical protein
MAHDKPEFGKQYALTGGRGDKAISNGNSWAESEVKKTDEKKHNIAKKMVSNKQDYRKILDKNMGHPMKQLDKLISKTFTNVRCGHCGKFGHHHSEHSFASKKQNPNLEKHSILSEGEWHEKKY